MATKPPYKITDKTIRLIADISQILGELGVMTFKMPSVKLRKKNRVRTIKSTLAIEGHTFDETQITAVLEKKKVIGTKKEILEVQNAIRLYESADKFKSHKMKDFLSAHKILMKGLLADAGYYRAKNVGIFDKEEVKHIAPKSSRVPELMSALFAWIRKEKELHPLALSAVVHYEIEFIHPFEDGNGRMGRFWQGLILKEYNALFKYVPVESLIERNQKKYYAALETSDNAGDATVFIEFSLKMIKASLTEMSADIIGITHTLEDRLTEAGQHFKNKAFSRKDYMQFHKNISSATASRDLKEGVRRAQLKKIGQKNQTRYKYVG